MIFHIDMDAFFASVEQAINPRLKGRPLIVGSRQSKYHTVVCAASYEAKRLGIDSGMPTKEAFRICPEAIFIAADSAKYLYVSNQIFELLKAYPATLHYSSIDEFDLEFGARAKNELIAIARDIKCAIQKEFQLTCSIGIAPNWQLAKLGSKIGKPDGLAFIDTHNYTEILQDMPVEKICGVGPALSNHLHKLGISTCGQLLKYPKKLLIYRFGKIGSWLAECLDPCHCEPLSGTPTETGQAPPKSIGHSYTLPQQTSNLKIILAWLRMLSEMVAQRLRKSGLEAHTVHVWLSNGPSGSSSAQRAHPKAQRAEGSYLNGGFSRQKTFQTGVHMGSELFLRSQAILGLKKAQKTPVRALGISVSGLHQKSQEPLLEKEQKDESLAIVMDGINDKYGDWTLYPAVLGLIHKK